MMVLYSCLSKSWGGMEMYAIQSAKNLIDRNIPTDLLCYPKSKIETVASEMGIKTIPVKAEGYFHPLEIIKLSKLIKNGNYDLIHSQASKDLWVLVPALKIIASQIPLVLTKQVGSFIVKKDGLHKWLYGRVNKALAISKVIYKNLVDTTPLNKERIEIVHNGINTKRFNPEKISGSAVRESFDIKKEEIVIGMLARFSWGKGHEEFLEAASKLIKKYHNLKFMIVGEPSRGEDEYAQKIYRMARELGLDEYVVFTGFRKDTPEVLASMDIFAFPSHSEAFGIALAEALASGKPSVCSASDGVLDIAVDNETSLLFEKQNAEDLADKLSILIASEEMRESFGKAARKRAVEKFDFEIITDQTLKIYNNLLGKS